VSTLPRSSPPNDLIKAFSDLSRLHRLHNIVESCSPERPPCIRFLGHPLSAPRSVSVLAGSFNPLTEAHLALAKAAEDQGLGPSIFALSTRTIDKEHPEGALLEDRLLSLELHVERWPARSVALLNRGLYVDQAELFRSALPTIERLTFLVGFDKIAQILDPRYYDDRGTALRRLFANAGFAVAPRDRAGAPELAELLDRPENRPFAGRVSPLRVASRLAQVSSSVIRTKLAAGEVAPDGLTSESAALVAATGCYQLSRTGADRYARRRALVSAW
jgi:nicotinamide-nucleotide adenylyltransferase